MACSLSESKAGVVLLQPHCFLCKYKLLSIRATVFFVKSSEVCIKDKDNNSSYNLTVTVNIDPVYKCVLFALFLLGIPKKYWPVLSVGFLRSTKRK